MRKQGSTFLTLAMASSLSLFFLLKSHIVPLLQAAINDATLQIDPLSVFKSVQKRQILMSSTKIFSMSRTSLQFKSLVLLIFHSLNFLTTNTMQRSLVDCWNHYITFVKNYMIHIFFIEKSIPCVFTILDCVFQYCNRYVLGWEIPSP